ncbi:MAG: helix-turn-helix transcriptional regulator [Oscillospiraceae bacterium]|jgi:AraC family transcriptional regulator|nr:helix-turn-helix transcriptional regulator [Oscillospiraceae bacterium]
MGKESPIFQSLELIESRLSEKLTVDSIARGVYFSKYHYQRLFREIVGDSVMEYVTKRKLTLAGRALLETGAPIIDIALEYGYDSREGFSRSFKAYMGVTPAEYRKYGLSAITQKTVKERTSMSYSKATNEIIRELNEFIAKTRDLAEQSRKTGARDESFWRSAAGHIDSLADRISAELDRINAIAEHPDEITNGFAIVRVIDDTVFEMNLLALRAALWAARMPEHTREYMPLAEEYRGLAHIGGQKAVKISTFFRSLLSLIIQDMKTAAAQKIREAIEKGKRAMDGLAGISSYIKEEIIQLVGELSSAPTEDITVHKLEDYVFKLKIISFTAKLDTLPDDGEMLECIHTFTESLVEAADFCGAIVKPLDEPPAERKTLMIMSDIAYQGNILIFYTKGEIERLRAGGFLDDAQKTALDRMIEKMNACLQISVIDTVDVPAFKKNADKVYEIVSGLDAEAEKLGSHGGAMKLLANEHRSLTDRLIRHIQEYDAQHKP